MALSFNSDMREGGFVNVFHHEMFVFLFCLFRNSSASLFHLFFFSHRTSDASEEIRFDMWSFLPHLVFFLDPVIPHVFNCVPAVGMRIADHHMCAHTSYFHFFAQPIFCTFGHLLSAFSLKNAGFHAQDQFHQGTRSVPGAGCSWRFPLSRTVTDACASVSTW